jgi:UDP-N-acetylglucosamine--N-acetylmuramyl-(pentapeptide) pyrophosphoryl-undecaprenol N-acetylglucosamine transferase
VIPGLTTKFLSRYASTVAVSFSESESYLTKAKQVIFTGNPRATDVIHADPVAGRNSLEIPKDKKIILLFGGSQGAKVINNAVLEMLPFLGELPQAHFVYITGEGHYEAIRKKIPEKKYPNLDIQPFLYNMPEVLKAAHAIVCRAGASTLAEITSIGLPSVLIPSPYVTNNHQVRNAKWLEENGACKMIEEKDCTGPTLWSFIREFVKNESVYIEVQNASRRMGFPEARDRIVDQLEKLIKR